MSSIADWVLIAVTTVYSLITLAIYYVNKKSVDTALQQLKESQRQFDETRRLQSIPFLQVSITEYDRKENGSIETPYTFFEISESDLDKRVDLILDIVFKNVGLGMLHHGHIMWNSLCEHDDEYPENDIFLAPNASYHIRGVFSAERANNDSEVLNRGDCQFKIAYEDLVGNKYSQELNMLFIIRHSSVRLIYHQISSPALKQ